MHNKWNSANVDQVLLRAMNTLYRLQNKLKNRWQS